MMKGKKELRNLIGLPPSSAVNFSDLISSFVFFLEVSGTAISLRGKDLLRTIEPRNSIVFVFVDGLGSHFLSRLPDHAFLNRNRVQDIFSVFPSTTPCAMLNCSTGLEPALHGIPGRWTFLRDRDIQVNTLTIAERFSGKPVVNGEIPPDEVWKIPSIFTRTEKEVFFVIPGIFTRSLFERYLCGSNPVGRYHSVTHAVDLILDYFRDSGIPAFSFLYLLDLDTMLHNYGTEFREVDTLLETINAQMDRLAASLPAGVRLCISADHGQITIPPGNRIPLFDGDPLFECLETYPYGEPRVPHFSVKKGLEDDFKGSFLKRFGSLFHLFSLEEVSESRLFGRNELSESAKKLYGDFIGVAKNRHTFRYYQGNALPDRGDLGEHGGSDPEEIIIPLILT